MTQEEKSLDIQNGLRIRENSVKLVDHIISLLTKKQIEKYKKLFNIVYAISSQGSGRSIKGVAAELAFQSLLTDASGIPDSVKRIDEITGSSYETGLYDLLVDFRKWGKKKKSKELVISMLMATNQFNCRNDADDDFECFMASDYQNHDFTTSLYFPIQVKRRASSGNDLMSSNYGFSLNTIIDNLKMKGLETFTKSEIEDSVREVFENQLSYPRHKFTLWETFSGLFFNSYSPLEENYSLVEVMPMTDGAEFFPKNFENNYKVEIEGDCYQNFVGKEPVYFYYNDFKVKLIPKLNCRTDIGFIVTKSDIRYCITNRKEKNQNFKFKVDHILEKGDIKEAEFINCSISELMKKKFGNDN